MNVTIIVLIIIIVFLVYFLYRTSKKVSTNSSSKLYNLNKDTMNVYSTDLTNPKSQSFSYCTWIFVNSWNTNQLKNIYKTSAPIVSLDLDTYSPKLTATVGTTNIIITQNFPIQKWVYVVISVDSNIVDCYLDGKLITSTQLNSTGQSNQLPVIPDSYTINSGRLDAYLTGFKYDSKPLNPQQVWSNYMAGNGYSGGKYGVNVAITKDEAVVSQVSY